MEKPEGFEWDEANRTKNWLKHRVSTRECEEVFANIPLKIGDDPVHSGLEKRYTALGHTNTGRLVSVVFTIRGGKIRVISARNQSKKERRTYEVTKN